MVALMPHATPESSKSTCCPVPVRFSFTSTTTTPQDEQTVMAMAMARQGKAAQAGRDGQRSPKDGQRAAKKQTYNLYDTTPSVHGDKQTYHTLPPTATSKPPYLNFRLTKPKSIIAKTMHQPRNETAARKHAPKIHSRIA